MLLSDLSVKRPVFATVINLLLVIFGVVAISMLPLREYPDIDPPIVTVNTSYPGANAEIVETKITELIEARISGIAGVKNITSTSRNGRSSVSIEFNLSRDIDAAANDVRERISRVLNNLPDQALPPEVTKSDSDQSPIIWFNLRSEVMNVMELTDYAERYIVDRLSVVDGVGSIRIGGGQTFAMKVWLDRNAMAARGITVVDVENALRRENVELPAGEIESSQREFSVRVTRSYRAAQDFSELVLKQGDDGYLVKLGEIGKVELTAEDHRTEFRGDGVNMVGLGVIKQSKANTLSVAKAAKAAIEELRQTLPESIFIVDSYDSSVFIQQSIDEVYNTLIIAMLMVILVIYLFLGNVKATFVPAITVPVALVAAFSFMYMMDFSINILTLLAMVLAIGLVVDDSIVVLENIYRRVESGEPPLLAAFNGAREVGFAVIATTLVLVAVFVPLVFLQGNIGRLFTEFALAIAAAVVFSSITALTLSPMLCSRLLNNRERGSRVGQFMDRVFVRIEQSYKHTLGNVIQRPWMLLLVMTLAGLTIWQLLLKTPSEFVPKEDRGGFFIALNTAEGATFELNATALKKVEELLLPYRESGEMERLLVRTPGFGGRAGIVIVGTADWDVRKRDSFALMSEVSQKLATIPDVRAFAIMRNGIGGRGLGRPVQFVLQGNTYEELARWRDVVLEKARENSQLLRLDSDYKETLPQLQVKINRDRASDLGVSVGDIGRTLETMLGQRRVTTFLDRGQEYNVIIEGVDADYRSPSSIDNIYVRSNRTANLIPLSNLVDVVENSTASRLNRFNRLRSVTISANLADDYTLGEALAYLREIVASELPEGVSIDYKGQSQMFQESGASILFIFVLALLITFLVLAAQFESFIHPLVIMFTVPLGLVGALAGLYFSGMTINIYSQIGIVMLIGLAAKNGILIVEFANQLRDAGQSFTEALIQASTQRLRPIVMTGFTTVMSAIPLVLASGAGAESRAVLGMVIFSGVLFATVMTIFVVPTAYFWIAQNTGSPKQLENELQQLRQKVLLPQEES